MRELLEKLATVAGTDVSVVLRGESGTGKEVIARALHANSHRCAKPFVAINCAALPSALLESELFGHARGAFTGAATARRGLFEAADGGTLFLDEIAEMSLAVQAKLLRALQDGEVRRVGESSSFRVDVRPICATHQHLQTAVREGRFREDLYFRLKVFSLVVPPLRERREDIPVLADAFMAAEAHPTRRLTPRALDALLAYSWPGNVRELLNAIKHGAVLSKGADIDLPHLPDEVLEPHCSSPPPPEPTLRLLADVEKQHIIEVLRACGGNRTAAAKALGISRTSLWRRTRSYGLVEA